jgi:hypothetical protein
MGHALDFRLPPIALSASLSFFARVEEFPVAIPPDLPLTRRHRPVVGKTVEDIEYYNRECRTLTVPHGPGTPGTHLSARHDWDWLRTVIADHVTSGSIQRYTPGILTGKWRGTLLVRLLHVWCCALKLPPPPPSPVFLILSLGTIRS